MTGEDSISLRDFMTEQISRIERRLDALETKLVGREQFDMWCNQLTKVEATIQEHDRRLAKVERAVWLLQIAVGMLMPILTAVLIALLVAWVTGQMEIRFRP